MKNDHFWIVAWFVAAHNKPLLNVAALASIIIPKNLFFPSFGCGKPLNLHYPPFKLLKTWVLKVQTVVYFLMPLIYCKTSSSFLKHATPVDHQFELWNDDCYYEVARFLRKKMTIKSFPDLQFITSWSRSPFFQYHSSYSINLSDECDTPTF